MLEAEADVEECDENDRLEPGGEVGKGTSSASSATRDGDVARGVTENVMEGCRVAAAERIRGEHISLGDGGETTVASEPEERPGFTRLEIFAFIRREFEVPLLEFSFASQLLEGSQGIRIDGANIEDEFASEEPKTVEI